MNRENEVAWYRGVTTAGRGSAGEKRLVGPDPGHARQTAEVLGRELVERGGGEVEVGEGTACAAVGDRDGYGLALVC